VVKKEPKDENPAVLSETIKDEHESSMDSINDSSVDSDYASQVRPNAVTGCTVQRVCL
jgi:hypothetical protein